MPRENLLATNLAIEELLDKKWTLKWPVVLMASYVDEILLILNEMTGKGTNATVLREDTVAPLHASGPPFGLAAVSVAVMMATG